MKQESLPLNSIVVPPMSATEVVDAGLNVARRNFRLLILTTMIGQVPIELILAVARRLTDSGGSASPSIGSIVWLLIYLAIIFAEVALVHGALIFICAGILQSAHAP